MIWILYIVGGFVGLFAIMALVGRTLPAGHVAVRRATLGRPPDDVWHALVTLEAHPSWRHGVTKIERL